MKIISLYVENIKKIKALEIKPDGNTIIISGKNGNGKSSTIDAIAMALGGKKLIPAKPVREGETTAKIEVDLGKYKVTRHWTNPDTSYLKVETQDGAQVKNSQGILNDLIGDLTFDPLAFSTMEPEKRLSLLKEIVGVDFTPLEKEYAEVYQKRRDIGRVGEQLKARVETEFSGVASLPETQIDIEQIKKDRQSALDHNNEIVKATNKIVSLTESIQLKMKAIEHHQASIELAQKRITEAQGEIDRLDIEAASLKDLSEKEPVDFKQFDDQMTEYFKFTANKEKLDLKAKVESDLEKTRLEWKECDNRLKAIVEEKGKIISDAKMPISGLSFSDNDVSFNDMPFAQLSMAEQIKVSMSIAIATNPKLKIALIHNGSLLDSNTLEQISQIAKDSEMQVWIERVADKAEGDSIYIEDGEIKGEE